MVRTVPFGNPQKIWGVISDDNIFHSQFILFSFIIWKYFVACPFPTTSNFYSSMFLHKISTQMVCVNGNHLGCPSRELTEFTYNREDVISPRDTFNTKTSQI